MTTRVQGLSGYVWITCACGKEVQRHADLCSTQDGEAACDECTLPPTPTLCTESVWNPDRKPQGGWTTCILDRSHKGRCEP